MYKDPVLKKYEDLIKAKRSDLTFYQGDPVRIPDSNLPCVLMSKFETRAGLLTNSEDEHGIGIRMTIITSIRKDLSTSENDNTLVEGVASLYDICEGRNADYSLKDTSLLDILRANQVVDAGNNLRTDLDTLTRIDYGETLRDRDPEVWSVEARIEFVAHFVQTR